MFGYIKPLDAQLRVCELEEYRAVYCGLCRALSRRFGPLARATLSYDFTFITMLALSLQDTPPSYSKQRCPLFPLRRRLHLDICSETETTCDMALLLLRESCADHVADSRFPKALMWHAAFPIVQGIANKAAARRTDIDAICRGMTEAQAKAESDPNASVDLACDATATALAALLTSLSDDGVQRQILNRLGYMLGRFIYLCDAVDDLDDDRKSGAFNPLLHDNADPAGALHMTIAECGHAYALLEPNYYRGILDNIIYLGLQSTADRLLNGGTENEKSI